MLSKIRSRSLLLLIAFVALHVEVQNSTARPMSDASGFNEGSFRSFEVGKSLREFTVGPAPEGSLDRALASTSIPILALDLRELPTQGPAAQWLDQPHLTHSIGATYSDESPNHYFLNLKPQDVYDVLLFVAKTNAARGN